MEKMRVRVALAALSALTMGALATASGVSDLAAAFPKVPVSLVQMLITLPILVQTPVTLFCSVFCRRASKKRLLQAACVFFIVGGVTPFFVHSFPVIMLMRCLYGAGVGLVVPLTAVLAAEYFEGAERAAVMGLNSAVGMLGGAFYTFAGGQLSVIGWQYCFLAYWIGVPVLLIATVCLPQGKPDAAPAARGGAKRGRLPGAVFGVALLSLVYLVLYFAYTNNISLFVAAAGLGTAAHAGMSYSIVNLCGFGGGLLFGRLHERLHGWTLPVSVGVTTAGFFIIAASHSLPVLYAGSVLIGVGLAWFLPQTQTMIGALVPPERAADAFGVNGAISNAGQFLSAPILGAAALAGGVTTERGMLLLGAAGYVALTLVCIPLLRRLSPKKKTTTII